MTPRILALLALSLAALVFSACGSDDEPAASASAGNGTDRAFVDEMVPHHQAAVDMAKIAQERGESEFVKTLADDIVAGQTEEITTLRRIAPSLRDVKPASLGGMSMMNMDMDMLRTAKPFDRAFMEMMIPHHQSAIEMARAEVERGENPELKTLAEAIITEQEREINEMRKQLEDTPS